ncbi:MAG: hypothetical protein ABIA78_02875 [archaeon]
MEMIEIPREEFERMNRKLEILKDMEGIDLELLAQFKRSLEDVKDGRIRRVA